MADPRLQPLDKTGIAPRTISSKLRSQLAYFASLPSSSDGVTLGENEYFFPADETAKTLDDGVLMLVSPLDTANMTEVEISEEQEDLLHWLTKSGVQHVRVIE